MQHNYKRLSPNTQKKLPKKTRKKRYKKTKKNKHFRQKGGNYIQTCAHKFDGVDFCRKCCSVYKNNYEKCIDLCMTPK